MVVFQPAMLGTTRGYLPRLGRLGMYTLKQFALISMVLYFSPAEGSWVQLRAGASHVVALAVTKRRPQMEEIGAFQHGD